MLNKIFIFTLLICSCQKGLRVEVKKTTFDFPDLQVEKEYIELHDFNFETNDDKICLDKKNQEKLLQNINNIKVAYYKTFEKYKLAIKNYNELKKIAYEE